MTDDRSTRDADGTGRADDESRELSEELRLSSEEL
jgi:hypothetical protein